MEYSSVFTLLFFVLFIIFLILYLQSNSKSNSNNSLSCYCPYPLFFGGWVNCKCESDVWTNGNTICPGRFGGSIPTQIDYSKFNNVWLTIGGADVTLGGTTEQIIQNINNDIDCINGQNSCVTPSPTVPSGHTQTVTGICYDIEGGDTGSLSWDKAVDISNEISKSKNYKHIFTPEMKNIQKPKDLPKNSYLCPMMYSGNDSYSGDYQSDINDCLQTAKEMGWDPKYTILSFQSYSLFTSSDRGNIVTFLVNLLTQGYAGLLGWPAQDNAPQKCTNHTINARMATPTPLCYPQSDNLNLKTIQEIYYST